jgi:hypothetical protein
MHKSEPVPKFVQRGEDPRLDALLEELRRDGEAGDPLFADYRKLRDRPQRPQGGRGAGVAGTAAQPRRRARWLVLGGLLLIAPIVALALGVLLESLRHRPVPTAPASAAGAGTTGATVAAPAEPTSTGTLAGSGTASQGPPPARPAAAGPAEAAPSGVPEAVPTVPVQAAAPSAGTSMRTAVPPRSGATPKTGGQVPAPASSGDFFLRKRGP